MSATYKVSYVVLGEDNPGAILNLEQRPEEGQIVELGEKKYKIIEVVDLIPPKGDFIYLHATLEPVHE
ncbi:MAG: hypothetical protein PVF49_08645 [Anaerolineales bacterium]|jgi:hypothetical protein